MRFWMPVATRTLTKGKRSRMAAKRPEVCSVSSLAESGVYSAVGSSEGPLIHIAGVGFWFGLFPVTNRHPRIISVTAREPCVVAQMPQAALQTLLDRKPEMWRWLSLLSLESAALAIQALADLLISDKDRRCAAVLLRIAGCRESGDVSANASLTQDDLAALSNLSRPTISVVVRRLAARGFVSPGYGTITINMPAQLRRFVDETRPPRSLPSTSLAAEANGFPGNPGREMRNTCIAQPHLETTAYGARRRPSVGFVGMWRSGATTTSNAVRRGARQIQYLELTDIVEEVRFGSGAALRIGVRRRGCGVSRRYRFRHRDELREFPEVLGGCCEVELIAGAIWTA